MKPTKPVDKSKKNHNKGGKRPGAGRPKGAVSQVTKKKLEGLRLFKKRVAKNTSKLMNAQMALAKGCSFLFRIDKDEKGHNKRPVKVTDEEEIIDYLDGDHDNDSDSYYYISTEKPDNKAIDSMLDRTYGKAKQSVDLGGEITINHSDEAGKRLLEKYR